ncbi:MAG: hypothetical protein KKF08_19045 [Gammaproteobacteria bacterium]|nr:hypothetical protein [Gammaproteobacteria bacterium]
MNFKTKQEFRSAVIGIIMSDGYLSAPKKNAQLITGSINSELADFYVDILSWLTKTRKYQRQSNRSNNTFYRVETRSHPLYTSLWEKFYQGKPLRKTYHPFMKYMDAFGLYLLLLGDGSKNGNQIRLHFEGFSRAENMAFQSCFKKRFDLQAHIHRSRQYYNLSFTGENRNKLYYIVEPYLNMVPSMKYKFPTKEEVLNSETWPEIRKNLPKNNKGQFISGSRHSLTPQVTVGGI